MRWIAWAFAAVVVTVALAPNLSEHARACIIMGSIGLGSLALLVRILTK